MSAAFPVPRSLEEAVAVLAVLWEELAQLRAENVVLRARVIEVEARLKQDSSTSSRPPSSDPPSPPPRPPQRPIGRPRGAQPEHEAHQRLVLPPEQVDRVVGHWPRACGSCGQPLAADPGLAVGEPQRHQVTELPPLRAEVTEHQLYRLRCSGCGGQTRASLPPEVPRGAFGPRLQAAVALLSGRYRLSRREVADVCDDLLGAQVAVGSVDALCQATAEVRQAPVGYADETDWRQAGQRQWLWVVVSALATVFTLPSSRGSGVIKGLLGLEFAARLVSDRWSPIRGWRPNAARCAGRICVGISPRCWSGAPRRRRWGATPWRSPTACLTPGTKRATTRRGGSG